MCIDCLLDDWQAQSRPGNRTDVAGTVEDLKQTFLVFLRYPDPFIAHTQDDLLRAARQIEVNVFALWRVFDGVRDQILVSACRSSFGSADTFAQSPLVLNSM